jgi:anti-sigma factor RsiW
MSLIRRRGPRGRGSELTCHELVRLVSDYLEETLTEHDRRRFERHIRSCDGCTTYLEQIRQTIQLTGELREETLDPQARDALLTAFDGWASAR